MAHTPREQSVFPHQSIKYCDGMLLLCLLLCKAPCQAVTGPPISCSILLGAQVDQMKVFQQTPSNSRWHTYWHFASHLAYRNDGSMASFKPHSHMSSKLQNFQNHWFPLIQWDRWIGNMVGLLLDSLGMFALFLGIPLQCDNDWCITSSLICRWTNPRNSHFVEHLVVMAM